MSKWKKSPLELQQQFLEMMTYFSVENRQMFGYPCCFVNGNMMSGLHEENWIVRLSEKDREKFQKTFSTRPFEPMKGRVMREYLVIPLEVRSKSSLLKEWLEASFSYVSSLPPKAPKKKKKKKA